MSGIDGIRPAGIDNAYYVMDGGREALATRTAARDACAMGFDGNAYRPWSPATSKLASMVVKGMRVPINRDSRVLYLGAASGTTVSHVADIACDGIVFAVEFAPRPARDLLKVAESWPNVIPIVADARQPADYPGFIGAVDVIYQDVAQPGQASIARGNAEKYLVSGGFLVLAIKAKSISSTGKVGDIYRDELRELEGVFEVLEKASLEPLHHGHLAVIARYRR